MGTSYKVLIAGSIPTVSQSSTMSELIFSVLDEIDQKMSTYKPNSEISKFNRHHSNKPFPISHDTLEVLKIAQNVSRLSNGAFDITVGPLVEAWGFGPLKPTTEPTDEELEMLRSRVGYEKIIIDESGLSLAKMDPLLSCDLSAVAKGYGVDRVAAVLDELGTQNYLIEVGGEVRTRGSRGQNRRWSVAVERPNVLARGIQRILQLNNMSLATSGNYRNFRMVDGKRLSHTLDPVTGRPVVHHLASVSVVHSSCAWADAWATALNVLGPESGHSLAVKLHLSALFIIGTPEGEFIERSTADFDQLFGDQP